MALSPWSQPWGRRARGNPRRSAELDGGLACSSRTASSATRWLSPFPAGDSGGAQTAHGCAQWSCLGHAESWPPGRPWLNRSDVIKKKTKQKMNEPQNHSHFTKIRQLWNTCESLSLSQPEPMMKATSCPSSNQPRDSSGHWPRKLRTSSRVSGHSPDTDINAGEDFQECVSLWEEWKWKHERNMLSLTL